ncbi:MAG TPA: YncE family protein [Isosphaeraceae bacterium]|nr:YncE family protein [Isosphaeraceae bacterium]
MKATIPLMLLVAVAGAWASAEAQEARPPKLLVLLKGENAMVYVDPASGKVEGKVPVGRDPHELAVSDDGTLAFASNYAGQGPGSNSLSVIDLASRKELHHVELGALQRPHGLWFADGKLYFTAEGSLAIGRYDPKANAIDAILGTGQGRTHMVVLSKDGKAIYTANGSSNTISIFERSARRPGPPGGGPPGGPPPGGPPPGGRPPGPGGPGGPGGPEWSQTLVPVGRGPEGFDVSPDGKELWTSHMGDGRVFAIDLTTKKVARTMDIGARAGNRLKFTPDGKLALVSDLFGGELIVMDVAKGTVVERLKLGRGASGILIPPGGERAYVALTGDNAIAVIDLHSLKEVGRLNPGPGPDGMAWLPGTR